MNLQIENAYLYLTIIRSVIMVLIIDFYKNNRTRPNLFLVIGWMSYALSSGFRIFSVSVSYLGIISAILALYGVIMIATGFLEHFIKIKTSRINFLFITVAVIITITNFLNVQAASLMTYGIQSVFLLLLLVFSIVKRTQIKNKAKQIRIWLLSALISGNLLTVFFIIDIYSKKNLVLFTDSFSILVSLLAGFFFVHLEYVNKFTDLKASQSQYRLLFNNMIIGIANHQLVRDENGHIVDYRIIRVNKQFVSILGLNRKDVINKTSKEAYGVDKPPFFEIYKKVAETNEVISFEGYFDKMNKYFSVRAFSYEKDTFVTLFEDITLLKKLEKEKLETDAKIREQQRLESIGTLASGIAHEINNPVNGIMNYSQLIIDNDEKPVINEYADEIIHETKRIAVIIKALLNFSENSQRGFHETGIEEIFERIDHMMGTVLKKEQIEFNLSIESGIPPINVRSQQVQQLLMNIIANSRDSLNDKFPGYDKNKIINVTVKKTGRENKEWLLIEIEDFGNGISKEIRNRIFDPFFSTKRDEKRSGLGLFVAFGIINEHKGKIYYDTEEGSYTKFFVELPY
ncbi:MAG: hypothetical protein JXQ23_10450 [Clostridia bacterium]|nr:hypothetical protein [Clostridia bacterium]